MSTTCDRTVDTMYLDSSEGVLFLAVSAESASFRSVNKKERVDKSFVMFDSDGSIWYHLFHDKVERQGGIRCRYFHMIYSISSYISRNLR